ncbi:MAG: PQQ-binding-like beta-propeller repeat protein [archaeon]
MEKPKGVSFVLFLSLVLSICLVPTDLSAHASSEDDWLTYRHDAGHTSASTSSVNPEQWEILWKSKKGVFGSPVVSNGYVYLEEQYHVRCFNATDGKEVWNQEEQHCPKIDVSPAIYEGRIYTSCYAFDALTGELLLDYSGYSGFGSPIVVNGILYSCYSSLSLGHSSVLAINATTGTKIWQHLTRDSVVSYPAVANGYVYFATLNDIVYAVDAITGEEVWNYEASGDFSESTSPTVIDKHLYIGSTENVYCLDALTGTKIWNNSQTGNAGRSSTAVANGAVYLSNMRGKLFALNASTGVQIWNATKGYFPTSPSVAGTAVFVSDSYSILGFNTSTGNVILNHTFYDPYGWEPSTAAIVNGVLYASVENELYAFGIPPPNWTSPLAEEPMSSFEPTYLEFWDTQLIDQWGHAASIAFDSNNNPHVCYDVNPSFESTTRRRLHYGIWNGTNWNIENIDPTGFGGIIVVDYNNNPHIIYRDLSFNFKHAFWNGTNWTITLVASGSRGSYYDITVDSMGNPHILYSHNETSELRHAIWNGFNWVLKEVVDHLPKGVLLRTIALDSDNSLKILFVEPVDYEVETSNSSEIELRTTHDIKYTEWNGSDWTSQTVVHSLPLEVNSIGNLVLDSKGNPHFSYVSSVTKYDPESKSYPTKISLNYAHYDGSTWKVHPLDSKPESGYGSFVLSLDNEDKPNIYYFESNRTDRSGSIKFWLYKAKWTGSNWNVETLDSNFTHTGTLTKDPQGKLHLLFHETMGTMGGAWRSGRLTYATYKKNTTTELTSWIAVPLTIATIVGIGLIIYYKKQKS